MKKSTFAIPMLLALLLPALAAASSDMYLKIEGSKDEARVVRCPDGSCVVEPLAADQYSVLICDADGKVIPTDIKLAYAVVAPRDAASGQASGKRMHSGFTIRKELARGVKPGNRITIDEAGTQLAIGTSDQAVEAARGKISKSRSNIQNN